MGKQDRLVADFLEEHLALKTYEPYLQWLNEGERICVYTTIHKSNKKEYAEDQRAVAKDWVFPDGVINPEVDYNQNFIAAIKKSPDLRVCREKWNKGTRWLIEFKPRKTQIDSGYDSEDRCSSCDPDSPMSKQQPDSFYLLPQENVFPLNNIEDSPGLYYESPSPVNALIQSQSTSTEDGTFTAMDTSGTEDNCAMHAGYTEEFPIEVIKRYELLEHHDNMVKLVNTLQMLAIALDSFCRSGVALYEYLNGSPNNEVEISSVSMADCIMIWARICEEVAEVESANYDATDASSIGPRGTVVGNENGNLYAVVYRRMMSAVTMMYCFSPYVENDINYVILLVGDLNYSVAFKRLN